MVKFPKLTKEEREAMMRKWDEAGPRISRALEAGARGDQGAGAAGESRGGSSDLGGAAGAISSDL
jgi:hypothetical protein